ncbi:MAG: hypothetical protein IJ894_12670 [Bacteroidales bacterium]|nr:hypothetical protein [Bacteroidales bacterium]
MMENGTALDSVGDGTDGDAKFCVSTGVGTTLLSLSLSLLHDVARRTAAAMGRNF